MKTLFSTSNYLPEDHDGALNGIKETMKLLYTKINNDIHNGDSNELIIYVNCYYENFEGTPVISHKADISYATIYQWYDTYLPTLLNLDDTDFDILID